MAKPETDRNQAQQYDAAMRRHVEAHLPTIATWLDPTLADLEARQFLRRPASFAVPVLHADLLAETGPERLLHVEYETRPDARLVSRMFRYRARIMEQYPDHRLSQHVIVLRKGRVHGHDDFAANGFALELNVVYLREHDPKALLSNIALAPFAALARGSPAENLAAALRVISTTQSPNQGILLEAAESLAEIRLDLATINRIRKENLVSIQPIVDFYLRTDIGQEIQELGRAEGRQAGRLEGRRQLLGLLLQARFGDDDRCRTAADRLAGLPEEEAITEIYSAENLGQLTPGAGEEAPSGE